MRIRTVKPEFWKSETLAEVSLEATHLFVGLFNYVDDEGRAKGNINLIKAELFPLREEISRGTVAEWLRELHSIGVVESYTVNGRDYIHLPTFLEHQRISKPQKSKLPPPEDAEVQPKDAETEPTNGHSAPSPEPVAEQSRNSRGGKGTGNREQGRDKHIVKLERPFDIDEPEPVDLKADLSKAERSFAEFWETWRDATKALGYPPGSKKESWQRWRRFDADVHDRIRRNLPHYRASCERSGQQMRHCQRWLSDRGTNFRDFDEPPPAPQAPTVRYV